MWHCTYLNQATQSQFEPTFKGALETIDKNLGSCPILENTPPPPDVDQRAQFTTEEDLVDRIAQRRRQLDLLNQNLRAENRLLYDLAKANRAAIKPRLLNAEETMRIAKADLYCKERLYDERKTQLNQRIRRITQQTQVRQQRLEDQLRLLQSSRSPIKRLPMEILGMIFVIYTRDHEQSPYNLMGVSKWWRNICLSTPRLWSKWLISNETQVDMGDGTSKYIYDAYDLTPNFIFCRNASDIRRLHDRSGRTISLEIALTFRETPHNSNNPTNMKELIEICRVLSEGGLARCTTLRLFHLPIFLQLPLLFEAGMAPTDFLNFPRLKVWHLGRDFASPIFLIRTALQLEADKHVLDELVMEAALDQPHMLPFLADLPLLSFHRKDPVFYWFISQKEFPFLEKLEKVHFPRAMIMGDVAEGTWVPQWKEAYLEKFYYYPMFNGVTFPNLVRLRLKNCEGSPPSRFRHLLTSTVQGQTPYHAIHMPVLEYLYVEDRLPEAILHFSAPNLQELELVQYPLDVSAHRNEYEKLFGHAALERTPMETRLRPKKIFRWSTSVEWYEYYNVLTWIDNPSLEEFHITTPTTAVFKRQHIDLLAPDGIREKRWFKGENSFFPFLFPGLKKIEVTYLDPTLVEGAPDRQFYLDLLVDRTSSLWKNVINGRPNLFGPGVRINVLKPSALGRKYGTFEEHEKVYILNAKYWRSAIP